MKARAFSPPHSGKPELEELAASVTQFGQQLTDCPLTVGSLVQGVEITAGTPKAIYHGLQRQPEGWIVTRRNAAADVFENGTLDKKVLTLDASANVTVDLWVF